MKDHFNREISYLRISVTDLCNLRCIYCMPSQGVRKLRHEDILSVEEIQEIVRACAACGITKVRVTGGEPLVRRGIVDICRRVAQTPGIEEVVMTTNGVLLKQYANQLKAAGLSRLNISLDTLKPEKYEQISRFGRLEDALEGIAAARAAGFGRMKINCVLMGGINDDEIGDFVGLTREEDFAVRFIELMPIGECADWDKGRFIPGDTVLKAVPELEPCGTEGVARLYRVPGWKGSVGLISPVTAHFCPSCNRIRVTTDGKLKPCLHSDQEISLKGLQGEALEEVIRGAICLKPLRHHLDRGTETKRTMNAIGG